VHRHRALVDGHDLLAARREVLGQRAARAADLERAAEALAGERGEGELPLAVLVPALVHAPRVWRASVQLVEGVVHRLAVHDDRLPARDGVREPGARTPGGGAGCPAGGPVVGVAPVTTRGHQQGAASVADQVHEARGHLALHCRHPAVGGAEEDQGSLGRQEPERLLCLGKAMLGELGRGGRAVGRPAVARGEQHDVHRNARGVRTGDRAVGSETVITGVGGHDDQPGEVLATVRRLQHGPALLVSHRHPSLGRGRLPPHGPVPDGTTRLMTSLPPRG
jgi:hypothetical protein